MRFLLIFLVLLLGCYTRPNTGMQPNADQELADTIASTSRYARINPYIVAGKEFRKQRQADSATLHQSDSFAVEKNQVDASALSASNAAVDSHSVEAKKIDSLNGAIETWREILFASNKHLGKMKEYGLQNAVAYSQNLLKNRLMDTLDIENALKTVLKINGIEKEKLSVMMSIREGNERAAVNGNIRRKNEEIKTINEYLYNLSVGKKPDKLDIGRHDSLSTGK